MLEKGAWPIGYGIKREFKMIGSQESFFLHIDDCERRVGEHEDRTTRQEICDRIK